MLSYQHGYHAGNFADVVKHFTLTRLLCYLTLKEKPIFYLETHAGRGLYDLQGAQAIKTAEASEGIKRLWDNRYELSDLFTPYLDTLKKFNYNKEDDSRSPLPLRYYPGSPLIALNLLRPQDRLFVCELHPQEFSALKGFKPNERKKFHVSNSEGLSQLSALIPPPERRGLIFIDPSYEIKTDYKIIPQKVKEAFERFPIGTFCIWYPIIEQQWHRDMLKEFNKIGVKNNIRLEFNLPGKGLKGMSGCGLWILNPPFLLENELNSALPQIAKFITQPAASFIIE